MKYSLGEFDCRYLNRYTNETIDLSPLKRDSSNPWTVYTNSSFGSDSYFKFNFCNVTVDDCHGHPGENPFNIYSTSCKPNFYQTGSTLEPEKLYFATNALTIVTLSQEFEQTAVNNCSNAPYPNRRILQFSIYCDMNKGIIYISNNITEYGVDECAYRIDIYSYLVCPHRNSCSNHGFSMFPDNYNFCECDAKTYGEKCENSRIVINEVKVFPEIIELIGFFANISHNSIIQIGGIQCNNLTQSSEQIIYCKNNNNTFGLQNITYIDGDLSYSIQTQFPNCSSNGIYDNDLKKCICDSKLFIGDYCEIPVIHTEPPLHCLGGDNACGGESQGICSKNGCICKLPWIGNDCTSRSIIIQQPLKNYSNPTIEFKTNGQETINKNYENDTLFKSIISIVKLRELDFNSNEVNSFNFEKWEFKEIDNTTYKYSTIVVPSLKNKNENSTTNTSSTITNITITLQWFENEMNISFANEIIKMNPSSIKYTIELSKYRFENQLNRLQLIMSAMLKINKSNNICSNKEFGEIINNEDNSNYLKIQIDNHSIYGRFIKRSIVDKTKIITLENSILDSSTLLDSNIDQNEDASSPEAFIGITIPYYQNQIIIDPDFSMLIESKEISSTTYLICSKTNE
ncbi:hypothetical protein ACTA71_010415 [Dictyostelium dimigraforme]